MINPEVIKDTVIDFNVEIIKAERSETIKEAVEHLKRARYHIEVLEKIIPEMKQTEHDLTQDLYNRLKPGEKPYTKNIIFQ